MKESILCVHMENRDFLLCMLENMPRYCLQLYSVSFTQTFFCFVLLSLTYLVTDPGADN